MNPRYLTKSRYKLAKECPTKLFYIGKPDYYNSKLENDFLMALAEGGYQVGELAKLYYPNGINVDTLDHEEALRITEELIKEENAVIYEGAFKVDNLFIRADIVVKTGNLLKLVEVKAKSIDPHRDQFLGRQGIKSEWTPYLEDVAFQKYVIAKNYPQLTISSFLCLCDKSKVATVDGLNQLFLIDSKSGRTKIKLTRDIGADTLGDEILITIQVDELVQLIWEEQSDSKLTFAETIQLFADHYNTDKILKPVIGGQCGKCEFHVKGLRSDSELKSGFHECWETAGLTDDQLNQYLVLDLWSFLKKDAFIKSGKYFLKDVQRMDLEPKTKAKKEPVSFLSKIDRQELQIKKCKDDDPSHFLDIEGLKEEMTTWAYPLHCIDFETTTVAIPFNKGRKPYEQIAFQFSHHVIRENGNVEHIGEWISTNKGEFPNFNFVRALKAELSQDNGSIFRYAAHENTVLNVIYRQLRESNEHDRDELCSWIQTISKSSSSTTEVWEGKRNMVDLRELVLRYYYHPLMKGSNSIKDVLPAILSCSDFLKAKYTHPIYGSSNMPSKNFRNHVWLMQTEDGGIINPYKSLPPIHGNISNDSIESLLTSEDAELADGGAAMIAYARMQFSEMSDEEFNSLKKALLRYCELDTLAMVMIIEAWKDWCK